MSETGKTDGSSVISFRGTVAMAQTLTKEQRQALTARSLQETADILYQRGIMPTRCKASIAYLEKKAMRKLKAALADLEGELDGAK